MADNFILLDSGYEQRQREKNRMLFRVIFIGFVFILIFLISLIVVSNSSSYVYPPKIKQNCSKDYNFDYYILALRWPVTECLSKDKCLKYNQEWLIHGLWPNRNDGTYPQNCCSDEKFDLKELIPIENQLKEDWPNLLKNHADDSLWRHEWTKHGTCSRTKPFQYFNTTLELYKKFTIDKWLKQENVIPSNDKTYSGDSIINVISKKIGFNIEIECENNKEYLSQINICVGKNFNVFDCQKEHKSSCNNQIIYPTNK